MTAWHHTALSFPGAVLCRSAMLDQPHVRLLADYVEMLRGRDYVPDFDPMDSEARARRLLLMEKLGPKTFPPTGSGFVSQDNEGSTARTLLRFLAEAEIRRDGNSRAAGTAAETAQCRPGRQRGGHPRCPPIHG